VRSDLKEWREPGALVETQALEAALGDPDLRIVDCTTWLVPAEPGDDAPYRVVPGTAEYAAGHIPGAVFLDIQGEISDPGTRLRFMAPSAERFAHAMGRLGIGNDSRVVLYSNGSIMWATRVWWMFRAFGFDRAAVLDGGFAKWQGEGRPVSTAPGGYPPTRFDASPRPGFFVDRGHVLARLEDEPGMDPGGSLLQRNRAQQREVRPRCAEDRAFRHDLGAVLSPRVVVGGIAVDPTRQRAPHGVDDPHDLVVFLAPVGADRHEVDHFAHALLAEEARDENIGLGQV